MDYAIVLLLGIIIGVLIVYLLRPALFVRSERDFAALETLYDQVMEELEEKHTRIIGELNDWERRMAEQEQHVRIAPGEQSASPRVQAVYDLLRQGYDRDSVARRLGIGKGEVELIIQLKNRRRMY